MRGRSPVFRFLSGLRILIFIVLGKASMSLFGLDPQISAGWGHSLFLKSDGSVWVTGSNNGTFGNGETNSSIIPSQVVASGVIRVAGGNGTSFLIDENNSLFATGSNTYGQLGLGDTVNKLLFTKMNTVPVKNVYPNTYQTLFL